jgi:cellulose synthase/poly-beta-1,6-N-acetylglucosamine synthase-like glycosyltransferase
VIAAALFWGSILLLLYSYAGYPALIAAWARLRPRPVLKSPILPAVTVLVVAHDEEAIVAARIANLLALDYPRDLLQILFASDGSTDATVERAKAAAVRRGIEVIAFAQRRGKPAVLNDVVRRASGEILVLADARQRFEPSCLRALVAAFADPAVGAVSGDLVWNTEGEGETAVARGVGAYRRYESRVRLWESRVDSSIGTTGAIYAVRRSLFPWIRPDTILDDVLIPMKIMKAGRRVLFDPAIRAYDRAPATAREEFQRKARTLAGNFQLFSRETWMLVPGRNRLWLQTISHKVLRLLGPALLVMALVANLALLERTGFRWMLLAQAAFYGAAAVGAIGRSRRKPSPLFSLPYAFCLANAAALVGAIRFLGRRQQVTWERASARPKVGLIRPEAGRSR